MTALTALYDANASLAIFSSVFVVAFIAQRVYISRQKEGRRLPPALPSVPVFGSSPFLPNVGQLPAFFLTKSAELGPIFSIRMGSLYVVVLNGKDCIREALEKCSMTFAGRTVGYVNRNYTNVNLSGILERPYGATFRRYHQVILSILKEFGFGQGLIDQRIHTEAEELVGLIKEKGGKAFSLDNMFNMCTLNVITSILFGQRCSQTDKSLQNFQSKLLEYARSKKRVVDYCPMLRFLPQYKNIIDKACDLMQYQKSFLEQRISEVISSSEHSFIKRFIEREGAGYDKEDLVYICKDLVAAGSDTTANSLLWALVEMANNQKIQTRVRDEVDSIVPADRYPSIDDMGKMPYIEAIIMELMRRRTVVPLALFHLTTADAEVNGYFIPNGTTVIPNLYSAHMDPHTWPEPHVFRPDRFLDEGGNVIGRNNIIPFSLGKRSCLGELLARQELFIFFTTLIQQFQILPPEGIDKIICEENFVITMSPTPFEVRLIPRQ